LAVVAVVNPVVAATVPDPASVPMMVILMGGVVAGTYGLINRLARENVPREGQRCCVCCIESEEVRQVSRHFTNSCRINNTAKGVVTEIVKPASV
jgi:hypothetical protein